jgi:hypothetical protein
MKHLRIRQQLSVADALQRERLLRALKLILEHQEANDASSNLCQSLDSQSATGGHDCFASPPAQTAHPMRIKGKGANPADVVELACEARNSTYTTVSVGLRRLR